MYVLFVISLTPRYYEVTILSDNAWSLPLSGYKYRNFKDIRCLTSRKQREIKINYEY